MIIKELFSRTYQLTKYNLTLVQPLLLFFLLLGFILTPISISEGISPAGAVMLISVFGLFGAFCAGWFNMFHKSIELSDNRELSKENRAVNSLNLFKEFFPGVGKYFPKIVFGLLIYVFLFFIVINLVGLVGEKFIGFPESVSPQDLLNSFTNEESAKVFLNKINDVDKIKIARWNTLTLVFMGLFSYLTMFWTQAVISEDKKPFSAYLKSLKTVFKNPLTTIIIFLSYWASIVVIGIISAANPVNFFIQLAGLMLLILVVVYFTMMMFLYFEKYRENNKENTSLSRADSIGEV